MVKTTVADRPQSKPCNRGDFQLSNPAHTARQLLLITA